VTPRGDPRKQMQSGAGTRTAQAVTFTCAAFLAQPLISALSDAGSGIGNA